MQESYLKDSQFAILAKKCDCVNTKEYSGPLCKMLMPTPNCLKNIPSPPKRLFVSGQLGPLLEMPKVAIVGSRKPTEYGRAVTAQMASELARAGVVIISGLALGIDAISHQSALDAGGLTIAVLPAGLNNVVPRSNLRLAEKITANNGCLVTEYPVGTASVPQNYIARNRLIAGFSDAVLITEAGEKSGSLHTARFGLEQGKDVLAVPGSIYSANSAGCNNLIKAGAQPVTSARDVLSILGIHTTQQRQLYVGDNPIEQAIIDSIQHGQHDATRILSEANHGPAEFNSALVSLEIKGIIKPLGNNHWALA